MNATVKLRQLLDQRRKKGYRWTGLLGDFNGNIVSTRPDEVYVRLRQAGANSYAVGTFKVRGGLRHYYNLPVIIEIDPLTDEQYVAGVDTVALTYSIVGGNPAPPTSGYLETHAATHEWRADADDQLQWLHTFQFYPLRVQPHTTAQHVLVQAGVYYADAAYRWLRNSVDVDLSAYYPETGYKWVLLYINAAGNIGVVDNGATDVVDLEEAPASTYALAAVRLRSGLSIRTLVRYALPK